MPIELQRLCPVTVNQLELTRPFLLPRLRVATSDRRRLVMIKLGIRRPNDPPAPWRSRSQRSMSLKAIGSASSKPPSSTKTSRLDKHAGRGHTRYVVAHECTLVVAARSSSPTRMCLAGDLPDAENDTGVLNSSVWIEKLRPDGGDTSLQGMRNHRGEPMRVDDFGVVVQEAHQRPFGVLNGLIVRPRKVVRRTRHRRAHVHVDVRRARRDIDGALGCRRGDCLRPRERRSRDTTCR